MTKADDADTLIFQQADLEQVNTLILSSAEQPPLSSTPVEDNSKRFILSGPLGHGGQGSVFLAHDNKLQRDIALKMLSNNSPAFNQTLLAEARIQAQIDHPNICKIYQVEEADANNTNSYLVMQYIPGLSALEWLQQNRSTQVHQVVTLMQKVCDGLRAMHSLGIIHRDIKPANIMITDDEENGLQPFMVDFGLADDKNLAHDKMTVTGTPAFMPPEQWQSAVLDSRSDVYSFGATLYQLLTGKLPKANHNGNDKNVIFEEPHFCVLPLEIRAIIKKCMQTQRHHRYPSARELSSDLLRYLAAEPVYCIDSKAYWLKKKLLKFRWQASLVFVLTFGGLGSAIWQYEQQQQQQIRETILTEFTSTVERLEADVRLTRMSPRHDITAKNTQWSEKITELKQQIDEIGSNAYGPGNYAIGRMYYALQQYDQALEYLQKAWQSGFQQTRVAYNLAMSHGAIYQRQKALAENIRSKSTRTNKLQALNAQHRQPAITYLEKGMVDSPYQSYTKALLLYYQEQFDQALKVLDQATDLPNWFYLHHDLRGDIYLAKTNVAAKTNAADQVTNLALQALTQYDKAVNIGRSDFALHLKPLVVYMRLLNNSLYSKQSGFMKAYEQAISGLELSQKISPQHHLIAFEQGRFLSKKSDFEAQQSGDALATRELAIDKFNQALSQAPDNIEILLARAWAHSKKIKLMQQRDLPVDDLFDEAIAAYQQIPNSHRDYIFYNYFAFLQHQQAKNYASRTQNENIQSDSQFNQYFADAINSYRQAIAKRPKSIAAYLNMGSVLRDWSVWLEPKAAKIKLTQAIAQYQLAAKLNAEHFVLNFNLAQAYSSLAAVNALLLEPMQSSIDNGLRYLDIAAKAYPEHPFVVLERANLNASQGLENWQLGKDFDTYFNRAKASLSQSLKQHPDNIVLLDGRAWVTALQQQILYFSSDDKITNEQNYLQAIADSNNIISNKRSSYYLLLLLNGEYQRIDERELENQPAGAYAKLAYARWLSLTGRFEQAQRKFDSVGKVLPSILWHYRLRHLKRWLGATQTQADSNHRNKQLIELKALIMQHFPNSLAGVEI